MKKTLVLTLVSISVMALTACGGESSSSVSSEEGTSTSSSESSTSSSSQASWDVSEVDGTRRILAEYTSHRTYGQGINGTYDTADILPPAHYTEDTSTTTLYASPDYTDQIDRSDETVAFASTADARLADFTNGIADGALSAGEISSLLDIIDTNDDIINQSTQEFVNTVLHYDYFYYAYDDDYNYVKTSVFDVKRYDNLVKVGTSASNTLYGDNYNIQFNEIEQTYGDGYNIYFIHDEIFPKAFRYNADDYKVTTRRDAGTLKKALTVGGGFHAKAWIAKYTALYSDYANPESANYNAAYSYVLSATKADGAITLSFDSHRNAFNDPVNGTYYDMDLDYAVTISGGIVSATDTYQRYTVPVVA